MTTEYVTRYVVTQVCKDGGRVLADAQQGRNTYATPEEAQARIDAFMSANTPEKLAEVWGLPLEVRPCKCYPGHFDPVGIFFE